MSGASAGQQAPENLPTIAQAHGTVASMVGRFSFKTAFRHPCPVDHRLPHKIVEHFCQIDFSLLHQQGLSYVCLDLDNTLMAQRDEVISPNVVEHLNRARKAGYIKDLCLISNVIFRGKRLQRLERIAAELNVNASNIHRAIKSVLKKVDSRTTEQAIYKLAPRWLVEEIVKSTWMVSADAVIVDG